MPAILSSTLFPHVKRPKLDESSRSFRELVQQIFYDMLAAEDNGRVMVDEKNIRARALEEARNVMAQNQLSFMDLGKPQGIRDQIRQIKEECMGEVQQRGQAGTKERFDAEATAYAQFQQKAVELVQVSFVVQCKFHCKNVYVTVGQDIGRILF